MCSYMQIYMYIAQPSQNKMRYVVGVSMLYSYYSHKNLYVESWFHKRYVCRYMQMNICKFISPSHSKTQARRV